MKKILIAFITICWILTPNSIVFSQEHVANSDASKELSLNNYTLSQYLTEIQKKINRNWKPVRGIKTKNILAFFKINRNGELEEVKLLKPSKDLASNESAIEAIKASAPFGLFPVDYTDENLGLEFEFNYKVWNKQNYKTISLSDYLKALESRIFMNWQIAGLDKNLKSVVRFDINADGSIDNVNVLSTSNSNKFDRAAILAVEDTVSFYTLPSSVDLATLTVTAVFDHSEIPQITLSQMNDQEIVPPISDLGSASLGALIADKSMSGNLITPSGKKLTISFLKDGENVFVYINNNSYKPENVIQNGERFKFVVSMTCDDKSKLLFKGRANDTEIRGIALDASGREGYWFVK